MQDLWQAALSQDCSRKAKTDSKWAPTDIARRRRMQLVAAASAWKLVGARTCRAARTPMPQCNSARFLCKTYTFNVGLHASRASNKTATQR